VKKRTRRFWIPAEDRALRTLYPHLRTADISNILGRPVYSVHARAEKLGVHKSAAFNASPLSGRNIKGYVQHGMRTRFPKGHVPANKGTRRPGWHAGRMKDTWFKKGQFPFNRDPEFYVLGALRVNSDGYIDMRVSFDKGAKGWRALHRILWQDAHGPVPPGHIVVFKDRDRLNVELENLELITLADNARRNVMWNNYPKPLARAIQLRGALMRRINRKASNEAQHR
jgi:hypothetical protein